MAGGIAHCNLFQDRISSFRPNRTFDPTLDHGLDARLVRICGSASKPAQNNPTVALDQNTSFAFDNKFYKQIRARKGVLHIDQQLAVDRSTAGIVANFAADSAQFQQSFAKAMIKMGSIEVLVTGAGEIRKNCRIIN